MRRDPCGCPHLDVHDATVAVVTMTWRMLHDVVWWTIDAETSRARPDRPLRGEAGALASFMNSLLFCTARRCPHFCCSREFIAASMNDSAWDLLVAAGWIIDGEHPRFTGPAKDPRWLRTDRVGPRKVRTYALLNRRAALVKVGRTTDFQNRLRNLETASGCELEVLAVRDGDVERRVHGLLAAHREHGEWFRATDDALATIAKELA